MGIGNTEQALPGSLKHCKVWELLLQGHQGVGDGLVKSGCCEVGGEDGMWMRLGASLQYERWVLVGRKRTIQRWDDGTVVGLGNGLESGPCLNLVSVTNSRVGSSNPFPYPEPRFLGLGDGGAVATSLTGSLRCYKANSYKRVCPAYSLYSVSSTRARI